ncbi:biogenesis of lysosome-related organelles complex 1 subunit 2 [Aricia agestis]|uniref:biogenesis of lysosome-related organelles complex 1 subunit 2 n=1 Tax=Aricia agestis TaxID=91739 RepID=UPI001C20B63B|nr:biogenesis of lysosome-related organelles complex 1 subunit 2 [Aricia agestis]
MSKEDLSKSMKEEARDCSDPAIFTRSSSFEMLDPHDPVISRLATQLFKKTNDYLQGEMSSGQENYRLLEEINRMAITKFGDMRHLTVNLSKTLTECIDMYDVAIKPMLQQIEEIDAQIEQLEANVYRLDAYSKQLKTKFKELIEQ